MKQLFLIALVLGSTAALTAQAKPAGQTVPAPAVQAPLPDEKTLTITDAPGASPTAAQAPSGDVTVWDFLKMFVILALVIGMILGFVWFMRKLSGQGKTTDSPIRVLHTQSLGGSRNLQVVEVGDEILLMGVSDSGISLVKDLTGTEAGDAFRLAASQAKPGAKTAFSDLLSGLLGAKPKIRPDVGQPAENSSDFLKKQRERLKNL
jgi:flagellar biosynthetic protein FliO